jgi:SMC interacting uncharacterized protein involved in chromosome segregation
MINLRGKQDELEGLQSQQLVDLVKDMQEKDKLNKQLIQKLIEAMDSSKGSSTIKAKLRALESALLQLSKENNGYKTRVLLMAEQKGELLGFMNTKNEEIMSLQKQLQRSYDDMDDKLDKQEPSTQESSSLSRNMSDSILTLLKLMEVPVVSNRYTEENLKSLVKKYEMCISK